MANDIAERLLARVKEIREALGLSQEAFAERAGLGYKYYQHVEAGRKRDIRLSTLEKLAKACGLDLKGLFDFDLTPQAVGEDQPDSGASPKKSAPKSLGRTSYKKRPKPKS